MGTRTKKVIAAIFLAMLYLPLVFINHIPNKVSELEKRSLANFPVFSTHEGKLASGIRSSFENWLNDNIGFRDLFVSVYSNIQYNIFGRSPNSMVELGKDGWMYYTQDRNLKIASGEYVLLQKELESILKQQQRINDKLKSQGIEYVLVLPPSKVSIYPEYIRSGDYQVRETPVDQLAQYIQTHSDIKVIPLKQALLEAKKEGQVFFKTDTHWTQYGAYMAYREIIKKLNEFGLIDDAPEEVIFEPSEYQGEMGGLMGNSKLVPPEKTTISVILEKDARRVEEGELYQSFHNILKQYNVYKPCYLYENAKKDNTLLMYGDSMFGTWNATELLAEHFNTMAYVWGGDIQQEYIDILKPKVVIYEITERYLDILKYRNRNFADRLDDFQAEIIAHDAPTVIDRKNTYSINITVKNTSSDSWSEEKMVRLSIWQDGMDYGHRLYLPDGIEVAPGEQYTFHLGAFVAPPNDTTYLEFVMCQEGITYFGERERVDITVIN